MVYCGKPSKGCAQCRAKRTKCDTRRPSCSQCVRAGRICAGYRDPLLLLFRDETPNFTGHNQHGLSRKSASVIVETPVTSPESEDSTFFILSPLATLSEPIESQATCFFFQNYVWDDSEFSRGYLDYLPGLIANSKAAGGALTDAVVSLGMVGLSNTNRSSNIMVAARQKYNSALRATNHALSNLEDAKSDQTLVTVMLLSLYETNTCNTPRSMKSWTHHINGALQVLHLRGKEQLKTRIGHQLFVQLRTAVVVNCLQRRARVPEIITEWAKFAMELETGEEIVASVLSGLVVRFCNLRATMDSFHDYRRSADIVLSALEIDAELEAWAADCPNMYIYEIVTLQKRSESVYSDYYHVYCNIWIATIWNHYRSIRVLLNELVIEQLAHLKQCSEALPNFRGEHRSVFYERQIVLCRSLLLQLTQDICASVPFFLSHGSQGDCPPRAAGGNLLLWSLYTAGCTDVVSNVMRIWVIGNLEKITETMGVQQGKALAHLLRIRKDPPERPEDLDTDEW